MTVGYDREATCPTLKRFHLPRKWSPLTLLIFRMRVRSIARHAIGFLRKRSNFGVTLSGWRNNGGRCPWCGQVPREFEFVSEIGPVRFSGLFGDKDTLMVYSMMYGPERKAPCPMCTSFLNSWNGTAINLRERVAMVVTARSPIERLLDYKRQRGFANLPFVSDMSGDYTRTYVNADDADVPGFSVFTRRDGTVFHYYTGEMSGGMADPGQDPRGAPDADPLWLMLDLTPEGRGTDWYPKLEYKPQ